LGQSGNSWQAHWKGQHPRAADHIALVQEPGSRAAQAVPHKPARTVMPEDMARYGRDRTVLAKAVHGGVLRLFLCLMCLIGGTIQVPGRSSRYVSGRCVVGTLARSRLGHRRRFKRSGPLRCLDTAQV
jgi:hypothetical protein